MNAKQRRWVRRTCRELVGSEVATRPPQGRPRVWCQVVDSARDGTILIENSYDFGTQLARAWVSLSWVVYVRGLT
jgi:hypothetical protein